MHTYVLGSLAQEPQQWDTILGYDPASGVVFYVRQNPWSLFDPMGLSPGGHVGKQRMRNYLKSQGKSPEQIKAVNDNLFTEPIQEGIKYPLAMLGLAAGGGVATTAGPRIAGALMTPEGVYGATEGLTTGVEIATGYEGPPIIPGPGDVLRGGVQSARALTGDAAGIVSRYSGELIKVSKADEAADALATKLGGESRVRFANDDAGREFDAVSDEYIAQAKPALQTVGKKFRDQAKATFEAAKETGRKVYYEFSGDPSESVISKINQYSEEFNVEAVIDVTKNSDD
jgi:Restriction endonuclease fold toxin 3